MRILPVYVFLTRIESGSFFFRTTYRSKASASMKDNAVRPRLLAKVSTKLKENVPAVLVQYGFPHSAKDQLFVVE